jgi:hypothetical protein
MSENPAQFRKYIMPVLEEIRQLKLARRSFLPISTADQMVSCPHFPSLFLVKPSFSGFRIFQNPRALIFRNPRSSGKRG